MIHFEHVSKIYETSNGPVRALDDVSLDVALGEFVAVRGPSGCGKSTLLMLVGGLASATGGRVMVDGLNLGTLASRQRAQFRSEAIGFVFQMFHLLPYLSVLDNVLVAAVRRGNIRQRAADLLDRFQLAHRLTHRPAQLSVGERQRVAIARALINEPRLVLADEPTGNLDPDNAATVLEMLAGFHRAGGTVLLVTHDQTAANRAQRVLHLEEGRLK